MNKGNNGKNVNHFKKVKGETSEKRIIDGK